VLKADIMPSAVSTPIKVLTWGASVNDKRPVPEPISRTSRAAGVVRGEID
jgi:hypothetical protein